MRLKLLFENVTVPQVRQSRGSYQRLWLLAATLVLALVGCGQNPPTADVTASATATSAPRLLSWRAETNPPESSPTGFLYSVAPSDGATVYACNDNVPGRPGVSHMWISHDKGAHWTLGGDLPTLNGITRCEPVVDATNPRNVFAQFSAAKLGASPMLDEESTAVSFDGGATWRMLPGHQLIWQLDSYQGMYYAAREGTTAQGADVRNLWVSANQMQTWRVVGPSQASPNPGFWLNTQTGALLLESSSNSVLLWRRDPGSEQWSQIPPPPGTSNTNSVILARAGGADLSWTICVANPTQACSANNGATWTPLPALILAQPAGSKGAAVPPASLFGIANDGAILAASVNDASNTEGMYRLMAGATAWQSLGPVPDNASPQYYPTPGAGMLWAGSQWATYQD